MSKRRADGPEIPRGSGAWRGVATGRERRRDGHKRDSASARVGALGERREGVAASETGRHQRKEYAPFY
jgi:hypothetical protein